MTLLDGAQLLASAATAVGVLVTAWQLRSTSRQALTTFEDSLSREYREIARELPVDALLGQELSRETLAEARVPFFRYFDLTNEQVFLRQMGRVCTETWESWREGIQSNLHRPAFAAAWADFKSKSDGSLQELMRLEAEKFRSDPADWGRTPERTPTGELRTRE